MSAPVTDLALWGPRVGGLQSLCLLLCSRSTRSERECSHWIGHLVPAVLLLIVVVLAWRRHWLGGVAVVALGVAYAVIAWPRGTHVMGIEEDAGGAGRPRAPRSAGLTVLFWATTAGTRAIARWGRVATLIMMAVLQHVS